MKEIRWHGRGGQGAKTVSQILAQINLREGKFVQAFPEFGPERSGAPMRAYNRISDTEILVHSGVYEPDVVVVLDESLLDSER
ncbi:2-oxoacid:acceptor oxidoreductase family protein, partial [Candidatus Bipolaricaulota bacterium]|nr:2-oxoacid:acceptor oxidoreductase family protein [Candidatus Bipolaricaulota bacterium]MBC7318646.1 2-oxoacid:acceptor oxidoreductase family protein [Candidatus Bipolaricaulota bacterium]